MRRLEIRLLGSFEIRLDGEPVEGFESAKVRALLAYLAVEASRKQRRDQLAGLLWPDWPQKSAMANLRYALADLRKHIGDRKADPPFLHIDRQTIQFNPESDCTVDVLAFEKAIANNQPHTAAGLYRGSFLEGFSLADSPAFEDWLRAKTEYYSRKVLKALVTLTEQQIEMGNYEQALHHARRAIEVEAWHEPAHRQVIQLLARQGRRAEAVAQYERLRRSMQDELEIEPSDETQALVEQMKHGKFQRSYPDRVEAIPHRTSSLLPPTGAASPIGNSFPTGTVTFLFTDIIGSIPLWETQPDRMAEALEIHNAALRGAIEAYGGVVFKTVGDAFQAAFPTAHQALRAAVTGQRDLQDAQWNELGELKVRMGLHTGEADLDPGGDEYAVSHTKNRVGRIHSAAHGGQIVMSAETKELVDHYLPGGVTLKDLGEHRLKGMGIPEQLYQVVASELESEFPPLGTESQIRHNLPYQPTPFIGRQKELAELDALLAKPDIRLVTIVGPGGMGKTRLALAAAEKVLDDRRFSDGVFFVNLAPLAEPDQIASATAEALDLRLQGDAEHTLKQQLIEYLQSKKVLLLLDNFEHLLDGVELVVDLVAETPGVKVLATSRERLHLRMEQVYPIEGLEFPDWETPEEAAAYTAVRLFLQSAHRNQPDFALRDGDDLTYLARICRLVGGMPLALELASSCVDMLPLSEIAAGLQEGLDFLETEARDMPARHRSVRAAIDHSWGKLDEKERLVFAQLSVFRGGFTREAAQAVADASLRQLERLVNKSFLKYDSSADRYQVHELMRQYGAEKLENPETVQTHHLDFFVAYVEKVGDGTVGPEPEIWVKRTLADMDNFRAAMDWAAESDQAQAGLRIAGTLSYYWTAIGDWREGRQRLERLLALPEAAEHTLARGYALHQAGGIACGLGDYETGFVYFEEGKAISKELGENGRPLLGWILLDHAEELQNRDMAAAQRMEEEAMAVLREAGEPWQLWLGFGHMGWQAIRRGVYDQAYAAFSESLVFAQKISHKWLSGISMGWLGHLLYLQGNYSSARSHLEQSVAILGPLGDLRHQPLNTLGTVALLQGDPQEAVTCFEERLEMHRRQGSKGFFARDLSDLGIACELLGDHVRAVAHFHEALSLTGDVTDTTDLAVCLLGVAGIQPTPRRAAQLLAAVQTAFDSSSWVIEPLYQTEIERIEKAARAALGEADFEAAYAEGKIMPVDKVIAMTLSESNEWVDGKITAFDWGLDRKAID